MMHTVRNMGSVNSASGRIRCICAFLFLALVLLMCPSEILAEDEQSGPFLLTSSSRTTKDIILETKIRQALRKDAQLRPLNLVVQTSGGVASLAGPVPTAELRRAVMIVLPVEGVLSVSDKDLYVSTSDQVGKLLAVVIQNEQPTQTRSASPGSPESGLGSIDPRLSTGPANKSRCWLRR